MNSPMEDLACRYVLDQLDLTERTRFEVQLAADPELVAVVREIESSLAREVRALPQQTPPARLLPRIEAELDRIPAVTPPRTSTGRRRWRSLAGWGIAAAIAAGVTATTFWLRPDLARASSPVVIVAGLDDGRTVFAELPLMGTATDIDSRFVQLATLAENLWENPEKLPARSPGAAPERRGYAVFDPGTSQGFIGIRQLPPPAPGKRYHLWIVDVASAQLRDAGSLPATGRDRGLYFFCLTPSDSRAEMAPTRVGFVVTEEDASGATATTPLGRVVLGRSRI